MTGVDRVVKGVRSACRGGECGEGWWPARDKRGELKLLQEQKARVSNTVGAYDNADCRSLLILLSYSPIGFNRKFGIHFYFY